MTNLKELTSKRKPNWTNVSKYEERLLAEVQAYRLREVREQLNMTQTEIAKEMHISQNRVSDIERGNITKTQIDTLRRYVEALGGTLEISAKFGSASYQLA